MGGHTAGSIEQRARAEGLPVTPMGWLSEEHVGKLLVVDARTLQRWRLKSTGPEWLKHNGRVWYTSSGLAEYLNKLTRSDRARQETTPADILALRRRSGAGEA